MTAFHTINKPWHEDDIIIAMLIIPASLLYFSFMLFPVIRGEWNWDIHGIGNLLATGLAFAFAAVVVWKIHIDTKVALWRHWAVPLSVAALGFGLATVVAAALF